jgi:hypothetical protein
VKQIAMALVMVVLVADARSGQFPSGWLWCTGYDCGN